MHVKPDLRNGRFYALCIVVGVLTGLVTVPYRWLLVQSAGLRDFLFERAEAVPFFHLLVIGGMWAVGLLIAWLVRRYPGISGSGIPQAEGVINGRFRFRNPLKMLLAKFTGGLLGIGMGLSLGREGPSVQMGAFMARWVGKWGKVGPAQQKYLITGGASAGLSSAFTAPLASAIFVIEEVEKFDSPKIAVSSLLGGIAAGWMAKLAIGGNPYAAIDTVPPPGVGIPEQIGLFLLLALLLSVVGKIFNFLLLRFQRLYSVLAVPQALKVLAVVVMTYLMGFYFADLVAGGESYLLQQATTASVGLWLLGGMVLLKLFFTPLCYATGFPGGIFLPLLVIGGLTGKWFALLMTQLGWLPAGHFGFFMLIGMSALFAAVVRSPITGLVLILEMTGQFSIFFPMIVVVGFTYFISETIGVRPIYDALYERLLPPGTRTSTQHIVVPFEVGDDSYMQGRRVSEIRLPRSCEIRQVLRDGVPVTYSETPLQAGDRIEIELESKDLESLYRAFRSLANE